MQKLLDGAGRPLAAGKGRGPASPCASCGFSLADVQVRAPGRVSSPPGPDAARRGRAGAPRAGGGPKAPGTPGNLSPLPLRPQALSTECTLSMPPTFSMDSGMRGWAAALGAPSQAGCDAAAVATADGAAPLRARGDGNGADDDDDAADDDECSGGGCRDGGGSGACCAAGTSGACAPPAPRPPATAATDVTPSASLTAVAATALLGSDALLRLCRNTAGFAPLPGPGPPPAPAPAPAVVPRAALAPARPRPAAAARRCGGRPGPDAMRAALGERGFYLARAMILRQQEAFRAQVYDLHRVARAQAALAAELAAPHAAATAAYAAEAAALLASRRAPDQPDDASGQPDGGRKRGRGGDDAGGAAKRREAALPPGGERPVGEDDRGARAVESLPLHMSLMLNIPSRLRKGILAGAPPGASAPASVAADLFWAPRKTAGVRRPVASRYPSGGGGSCLPAVSGATTVAQPCPRVSGGATATPRTAARGAPAASAPGALAAPGARPRPLPLPAAAVASPVAQAAAPLPLPRQASGTSAGAAPSVGTVTTSSGVLRPRALPAAARPPVSLPAPVEGPRPRIGTPHRSLTSGGGGGGGGGGGKCGGATSARTPPRRAASGAAAGAAAGAPRLPARSPFAAAVAPAASAPPPLLLAVVAGAPPRPFASLQLPPAAAVSAQLSGGPAASLSVPSINPFRPAPQLQPLLASQLMAGSVASGPPGLVLPQPFDPHTYWMQKHFGGAAPSASLGAPPPASAGRAPGPPPPRAGPAASLDSARRAMAAAAAAAARGPAAPAPSRAIAGAPRPPAVVHWWQDPKAVFGDGPGLLDPNAMGDDPLSPASAPPPLTSGPGRPGGKRASPGARGADSDSSCQDARGCGRSMPPPAAVAAAGQAPLRGSAFRAVERRAPKPRGSRQWSSRPSRIESVDSDGNDASLAHGGGSGGGGKRRRRGGAAPECSQRTDGSANLSAAAGILLSLSSGG
jgi:hypothetical protein